MTFYVKQVPTDYQESPLNRFDDFPENVFVFGNRYYNRHTSDQFENIPQLLDDLIYELEYLRTGRKSFSGWDTILESYTGRDNYTREQRKKWIEIVEAWTRTNDENAIFCDVLQLLTGTEYTTATIRGDCQGDWQYIIYPAEYGREWLETFECEYFNTGSEWIIHDDEKAPDSPDEINGYFVYCHKWGIDSIKIELSEIIGCSPNEIELYAFDGYRQIPKYTKHD